jgi:D-3-phosphoglycerate dehydrogenase
MSQWKILITDGLHRDGQALLNSVAQVDDRTGITAETLETVIGEYDAMIVRSRTQVAAALIERGQHLKVIGRAGVGVDNIDVEAAAARAVTVVNTPTATSRAVAEHTLALMFALARSLPRADAAMKNGQWIKKELVGIELYGKVLGIIGMGNIGRLVAQAAEALGIQVLGYDPFLPVDEIQERGAEPVSLEQLYSQADLISLHMPLNAETRGMINQQALEGMKPGVYLVCAARGGMIDESALLQALESGQVAGVGLDVFALEPPGQSELVTYPQVIATPHIAAQTAEAQTRAAVDIAEEVLAALRGDPLRWKVV